MLILTRRSGEAIMIDVPGHEPIKVVILGNKGNQVRVAIGAGKDVQVHRQEVYDRIHNAKSEVANATQPA